MNIDIKARFINTVTKDYWCPNCAIKAIVLGTHIFKLQCEEYDPEYEFDKCPECGFEIENMW